MINKDIKKDKKRKLRSLLAKLEPERKQEILVKNIEDDLKDFTKKVDGIKDNSNEVFDLQVGLELLRNSLLQKISELPTKQNLEEIKAGYMEVVKYVESRLLTSIYQTRNKFDNEVAELRKELGGLVSSTKLDDLERRVIELSNRGGGSMPLQVSAGGTVANTRYAEINFVGATASTNTTTRKTDITTGGGFTTWLPTETPSMVTPIYTFTFASATAQPSFIIMDGAWLRATAKDGTVNWTWNSGTLQATMVIPPQDDIVAIK